MWADDDPRWAKAPLLPTMVTAKVKIDMMNQIDTVAGTVNMKVGAWLQWNDPRLALRPPSAGLPSTLWSPQLSLSPVKGDLQVVVKEFMRDLHDADPGDVYCLVWYEGSVVNAMDLRAFPFDTDTVDLVLCADLSSTRVGGERNVSFKTDYRLLVEDSKFGPALSMDRSREPHDFEVLAVELNYDSVKAAQDRCKISVHISRRSSHYINKVIIPLVMTVLLNLASVDLPLEDLASNLSHSSTLFLSAVALLYVVQAELPKTQYQTAVDRIILNTMYILGLSCFVAVAAYRANKAGEFDWATTINNFGVPSLTALYIVALLAQIIPLLVRRQMSKRALFDRVGASGIIDEGVREHIDQIKRDPLNFGRPDWLPAPVLGE